MIRALTQQDAAAVAALDAEIFGDNAWSAPAWEQEAASGGPDRRYWVLTDAGAVVGYGGLLRAGSDADILTVAVAPGQRGRGHGGALVAQLLAVAESWHCQAVFLEVEQGNAPAVSLYRSMGFSEMGVRRHYYGQQRHAITMRRQLREPLGAVLLGGEPDD
jgi:ribosomal-protein-alanine N-acetyltransferase